MSNVAILKLSGQSDLSAIARDLKNIASESKNAGPPLKSLQTSLDQSAKSATTFGQKVKSFGSTFSSSIASVGTLGGTVLNLSRQYSDLGDAQIKVDKTQLKVSKTAEAVTAAQTKLNAAVAKYGANSAQAQQAQLDLNQAEEAATLAVTMHGEALEDQQRAQENFWIGLVPTVTSAGGSIVSVLNDIGGTKGIGGLKTKLSGLKTALSSVFSGFKGTGGIASGLTGIGTAASGSVGGLNGMATATTGLGGALKATALSMLPVALALGGVALATKAAGIVIHEIISIMKGDMLEAVKSVQSLVDFYTKIGSVIPMGAGFAIFTALKPEVAKLRAELEKVPQTIKPVSAELQQMDDIGKGMSGTIDNIIGGVLGLTKKADAATPALNNAGGAITGIGTSASTAAPAVTKLNTGLGAMKFPSADAAVFDNYMSNIGSQTMPAVSKAVVEENKQLSLLTKSAVAGSTAFQNMARRQQELAKAINVATQSMQKQVLIGSKLSNAGTYTIGAKKGQNAGGGGHYVTFRGGKQVGGGPGIAPPFKKAASGMHETISQPTWILAGEDGKERVDIGKPGSGGGGTTIVNVYLDGDRIDQGMRYRINKFQGVMK